MTMPMWASLASIMVACIRPLQLVLEHMQPVKSALNSAGNCSIPLTLVVLGAYFHVPKSEKEPRALVRTVNVRSDASLMQSVRQIFVLPGWRMRMCRTEIVPGDAHTSGVNTPGETKTVVVAVLSRMVLTPLVLLPLLALFMKSGATDVFDE
jgi:auxin efflux carrier family protein